MGWLLSHQTPLERDIRGMEGYFPSVRTKPKATEGYTGILLPLILSPDPLCFFFRINLWPSSVASLTFDCWTQAVK